ncbi:MAG: FKBP-type peptidyl-prolyl cis-trans isomerase, partial [Bacteroidetes bacterium]|nr:FKBP-type peptidyl-prolyl cis-trans isomerase [Bacteroidota bacterium]
MKKNIGSFLLLAALAILSSCGNTGYKKTKSGILYKIIRNGNEPQVKEGNILRFYYAVKLGSTDSVLNSNYGRAAAFAPVQAANPMMGDNYNPTEIFPMLHNGDSAVVVQLVDSLMKKNPMQQFPPFIKKGDKILITFKINKVYPNDSSARGDQQAEAVKERAYQEQQQAAEIAKRKKEADDDLKKQIPELEKWLADRKISAQKTGRGTFVEIKEPGAGLQADSGMYVSIRYAGKTLADGKV